MGIHMLAKHWFKRRAIGSRSGEAKFFRRYGGILSCPIALFVSKWERAEQTSSLVMVT